MKLQMRKRKSTRLNSLIKICCLTGALVAYSACSYAALSNNTLPSGGSWDKNNVSITQSGNNIMNIIQQQHNAAIKWNDFSIGANATVNFSKGDGGSFNILNYVNGSNVSQIYGTMNAKDGNVFLVNTAGTVIGKSAQINVGSLYVSNKRLDENKLSSFNGKNINSMLDNSNPATGAQMMSLGNIMANKITFDGDRIVLDTERVQTYVGDKLDSKDIVITTTNKDDVVLGYDAYDKTNGYKDKNDGTVLAKVNGIDFTKADGYMWVKDAVQLQAIDTNLSGRYALHNSIDATATNKWYGDKGFKPIGVDQNGKVTVNDGKYGFTGKFDGLDNSIFGLTVNRGDKNNVGLFGVVRNATIKNVTLTGGNITGAMNVGSVIGSALGTTTVDNVLNSINVTGGKNVGGIVGFVGDYKENVNVIVKADGNFKNLINTGIVNSKGGKYNEGDIEASNAGGLIGFMENSKLGGNSYNLGSVTGKMNNVGGLVGYAVNSTIGNEDSKDGILNNQLNVTGKYNVGGIVGNAENSKVQNVSNAGNVKATGWTVEDYKFYSDSPLYSEGNGYSDEVGDYVCEIIYINNKPYKKISKKVDVANAGGIAGNVEKSTIEGVLNTGDVASSSYKYNGSDYYSAGNVGGVVGKAVDTNISNALNKENDIRGAHNVGGIAGYFGNSNDESKDRYTVKEAVNSGGDIMATGARHTTMDGKGNVIKRDIVKEHTRGKNWGGEVINFGNMGGIVGMLDGDNTYITSSGNRGTVHSLDVVGTNDSLAGNTGGVVGRINRSKASRTNISMKNIKDNYANAAVSNSYNTGDVRGYWGVGGVIGMTYNGEAAGVYNTGNINNTRLVEKLDGDYSTVNMGGIVGATSEDVDDATTLIYDAYNTGRIGDPNYEYAARHVGGIAGRLNGQIEKAYNTGDIYNGYGVVGGIVGWGYAGSIKNSFNTGNITVVDRDKKNSGSQVGGIAGGVYSHNGGFLIENVYNLGTLRSFRVGISEVSLGGILGSVINSEAIQPESVIIRNAYTTGNLFSFDTISKDKNTGVQAIYGKNGSGQTAYTPELENVYYITPNNSIFANLEKNAQGATVIAYGDRYKKGQYAGLSFSTDNGSESGNVSDDGEWRIYGKSTPILNAFLPGAEKFFGGNDGKGESHMDGIDKIQYGTAHNPFLTIINAKDNQNLEYNWDDLGSRDNASFAVYGGGLTINNFKTNGYFGGLLYADGALNVRATGNSISLGSGSELFGSSVNINTDGKLAGYGVIVAIGNGKDNADVSISADKGVDLYGEVVAAKKGQSFIISDINQTVDNENFEYDEDNKDNIKDPYWSMTTISRRFAHKTVDSTVDGNINITSSKGDVNLFYGNMEEGLISAGKDINVTANEGNVYIDSDVQMGGSINMKAKGEALLDLSNIGHVEAQYFINLLETAVRGEDFKNMTQEKRDKLIKRVKTVMEKELHYNGTFTDNNVKALVDILISNKGSLASMEDTIAVRVLHNFVKGLQKEGKGVTFGSSVDKGTVDAKITVDLWDGTNNNFNLGKYDYTKKEENGGTVTHVFKDELNKINLTVNDKKVDNNNSKVMDHTYIKIDSVEQLNAISAIGDDGLTYNYAVMGDIDASGCKDYSSIADNGGEFTGKFDGRGNRIIGLKAENGLFGTIGENGKVTDVKIYSSSFTGETTGAIAAINKGTIDNVTGFGNTVEGSVAAGGLVGKNSGTITNVTNAGIAKATGKDATAGGIAGMNTDSGSITNATSNSAVVSTVQSAGGLGGVVGSNAGNITNVESKGIIRGQFGYVKDDNSIYVEYSSNNIGGIAGTNSGTIKEAYNKSVLSGADNVGGIAGSNTGTLENVSNAGDITGVKYTDNTKAKYTGGLVGHNSGAITNGRNNGYIEGHSYVGGLVGYNAKDTEMKDLVNDSSATIIGEEFVGGIAGVNAGKITASDQKQLINRGQIYGQKYVGGVAGQNFGWIDNTNNNVTLFVKDENREAKYFGGVVGKNEQGGTINKATNSANINAGNASYVGGVVGENDGTLQEMSGNYGNVIGGSFVGGVAGKNNAEIEGVKAFNEGKVEGINGGAGGLFGHNEGIINGSTLVNNGVVVGKGGTGTGGIFGYNKGEISKTTLANTVNGKVFGVSNVGGLVGVNEGTITGGRDEKNNYYKYQIYNNGTVAGDGNNVGGLVGTNNGSITAAYNTGVVTGNTNVGGIAGVNTGTIDQVFNSVFENNGIISGNSNVGAIVGDNNGNVKNAYTTTEVKGNADKKALVGNGNKVGSTDNVWMTYGDGENEGTNKLLSVFLTKLKFEENGNFDKIIYNAGKQVVSIKEEKNVNGNIELKVFVGDTFIGTLTTASLDNDADAAHSLQDYLNANALLNPNENAQNAGEHLLFGTQQISSNANNHNNLGFDISSIKFAIKKATIDVLLNEISRVYGDKNISNNGKYDFTYGSNVSEAMKNELANNVTMDVTSDGALAGGSSGKVTADANKDNENYLWNADIKINGDLANNYEVNVQAGKSFVTKADLTINAGDVNIQLGETPNYTGTLDKLVNGDSFTGDFGITDSKLEGQVGTHDGVIGIVIDGKVYTVGTGDWTQNGFWKNYNITLDAGDLTVTAPDVPPVDPDKPGIEDWKFWEAEDKYAWGKKREERERKAEIHYVDGGMEI